MKCSIYKQEGHNKRTCKMAPGNITQSVPTNDTVNTIKNKDTRNKQQNKTSQRKEVQAHGFSWERELISKVYRATDEELAAIKYNSKMDLPAKFNRVNSSNISVKTSCTQNMVCMADCLRVFDAVSNGSPIHLTVINYKQCDTKKTKTITAIIEVDLTNSVDLLFGKLTRLQIEELDKLVKSVPQKRKPSTDEYNRMYALRNTLQEQSGAIHLDIKCNSTQSRLQCSFNRFQQFIKDNPAKVVAVSTTNELHGVAITSEIASSQRAFKPKPVPKQIPKSIE